MSTFGALRANFYHSSKRSRQTLLYKLWWLKAIKNQAAVRPRPELSLPGICCKCLFPPFTHSCDRMIGTLPFGISAEGPQCRQGHRNILVAQRLCANHDDGGKMKINFPDCCWSGCNDAVSSLHWSPCSGERALHLPANQQVQFMFTIFIVFRLLNCIWNTRCQH